MTGVEEYEVLKRRVTALKQEQKEASSARQAAAAVEATTVEQLKQALTEQKDAHEQTAAALRQALAEAGERAAKLRVEHAKDKKACDARVERLTARIKQLEAQAQQSGTELEAQHRLQVEALQARFEQAEAHAQALSSTGEELVLRHATELEQLRAEHAAHCKELFLAEQGWKERCTSVAGAAEKMQWRLQEAEGQIADQITALQAQKREAEILVRAHAQQLSDKDLLLASLQENVRQLDCALKTECTRSAGRQCEVQAFQASQAQELDGVLQRVQQTIDKKQRAIANLKSQLQTEQGKSARFEMLLHKHGKDLLSLI
eukprot:jgi/Chlat1/7290/Chrsp58S06922